MNIMEIASKVDKSKENEYCIDATDFDNEFSYNFEYVEPERLKCYWVGNWCCTDSHVGFRMYYLDDNPVAFSVQYGRKCEENFYWFSKELAIKVKDYLLSLMPEVELNVSLCDFNEDLGDSYKIEFNDQLMSVNKPTLNNEPIEILERIKENPDYGIDRQLRVKLINGEEKIIDIKEINFKYYLA